MSNAEGEGADLRARPLPCDSGPGVSVPAADSGQGRESEAGSGHTGLAEGGTGLEACGQRQWRVA